MLMSLFDQMINRKIKSAFLILSFFATCGVSYSQVTSVVTMPNLGSPTLVAPNAASLGKYGEIPVSYYTGIPNITIPIYEIKSGSLDIPVSLSYHAGGIRVEEIASWVGLGWSLNAGGVITRQARGIPDEGGGGYLQDYSTLNSFLAGTMSDSDELYYFQQVERGNWDSQQDIFTYNVGGEAGKFLLDSTGNTLTIPSTRNKFQLVTYNGTANCWQMTDIHGIQYYFANIETTQTTPVINNALSPTPAPTIVTSWYLTKVVNAQGNDSINFIYTPTRIQTYTTTAQTEYLLDQDLGGSCSTKNPDSRSSSSIVMGVRLSQITFRNGSITFTANSQQRCDLYSDNALSSIEIKNTDSSFEKIYQCYQHYTSANGTVLCDANDEINNHLFLDSLRFSDAAGGNMGQYKFAYNTTRLPSRLSYDQDYWGFYNAAGNTSFVPTVDQVNPENGGVLLLPGANRNPSASNQAGILQSITYPTGGSTVFQYETNTASNYFSSTIGGIDIVDSNHYFEILTLPPSRKIDTTFQMNDNFAGLGGVNGTVIVDNGGDTCAGEFQLGCPVVTLYFPSGGGTGINSSGPIFLPQGTYRVTIDLSTVQDQTIIDNFGFEVRWQSGESEVPALKNNETVGGLRIKTITDYTENDSVADTRSYQYLFPDSTSYSSGFVLSLPEYTGTIAMQSASSEAGAGAGTLSSCTYYTFSSGSHYPLTATQSSYVGYKYVTELLGPNGQFGENIYTYEAPDLVPDLGNVANFPYPPSTSEDWKRGQSLHRQSYRFNQQSGQYELISEKISHYTPLTVADYANFQVARNTFYSGGILDAGGLTDYSYSMFNTVAGWTPLINDTDRVYDQINLSSYNQKATAYTYSNVHYQPLSITTNNSNGETTTAHMTYPLDYSGLTGADPFTQGVVALQNSNIVTPVIEKYVMRTSSSGTLIGTTQSVLTSFWSQYLLPDTVWSTQFTAPSTTFQPLTVSGGSLVRDGSYVPQLAQVRYDAHSNAVEQLKINDIRQTYLWDYNGEYPICKVINADSTDIAYTSFEADGTGNWVIGSGLPDRSMGITGTSSYNLSGSISKSGLNSSTTYIVSYWTSGSAFTIAGTISGYPVQGKTETINGNMWTLYVHKVTGQSMITVSGSGHIDELRLYPSTAQMTTYTYSPLVGMTSQTDVGNRVTYYQYDGLARLKRIRDQDYNILKTYEYQYQVPAGCNGCQTLAMETFLGTNTIGYPVGVFDIHGNLVGNATGASAYVSLWNSDTADERIGTLSVGNDSLHFNIILNAGQTLLASVTGCRYFQYDLPYSQLDGVRNFNGTYVDFGDGTGMHLGTTTTDTPSVIAPRTTYATIGDGSYPGGGTHSLYLVHTYPDSNLWTITFYHNDAQESANLDNLNSPATSLTKLENFRGNLPLHTTLFGGSSYQQRSATTVANITNWNAISTIQNFFLNSGDAGLNPYTNIAFTQDFMQYNKDLLDIELTHGPYYVNYYDSTFKVSTLKSDWNTYFTNLQVLLISDDQWNREDLSGLKNLNSVFLSANNQNHSSNPTNNPIIPLPTSVTDSVIIQVAAGAGQTISNGVINIVTGGAGRTTASQLAVNALNAKGWIIYIDGVVQLTQ
jgi:YD repeat-containing protein